MASPLDDPRQTMPPSHDSERCEVRAFLLAHEYLSLDVRLPCLASPGSHLSLAPRLHGLRIPRNRTVWSVAQICGRVDP